MEEITEETILVMLEGASEEKIEEVYKLLGLQREGKTRGVRKTGSPRAVAPPPHDIIYEIRCLLCGTVKVESFAMTPTEDGSALVRKEYAEGTVLKEGTEKVVKWRKTCLCCRDVLLGLEKGELVERLIKVKKGEV